MRTAPARLWAWLADRPGSSLTAGLLLAAGLRLPFVAAPFGVDEGGYLYIAQHWPGPGHWLYGDQWVDRPPALLLLFKTVVLLGSSPVAMRLVAIAVVCVLVASAWYAGRRLAGGDGALAASLCAAALGSNPALGGSELMSDGVGAMFVMLSFALLLAAISAHDDSPGRRAVALAGLAGCAGVLAFLSKQSAVVAMVVAVVVLGARSRRHWSLLLGYAVGALVPLAATLAWAAEGPGVAMLANALYTFRVASVRVVESSTSHAPSGRFGTYVRVLVVSGLGFSLGHLAYDMLTRRRSWLLRGTVAVAAACLASVIVASLNWYVHYWLAVVPLAAVGVALAFVPAERTWRARMIPRAVVAATVLASVANVALQLPVNLASPAMARFVAAAARPRDTMMVLWGQPNLLEETGLRTPYPYSWSLPVRVEDPHLQLFADLLAGPRAPTWLLDVGRSNAWHLETPRVARLIARRYHVAAVVCGHDILLRDGVRRSLGAGAAAVPLGRC
ncbi:glycosyltransferase family 39 protein [Nocardioides sp. CER19]|uniref:glycosyltransferase family 39 protein n=1 Tax=Nocardioides sp. CER19 TaxID=3038538 RepID=UPI002449B4EA|nr:glycosyltransferase family 39 protein [Nocardioides sp. CER19]MDH2413779.1 glycosyltransferase family 39 protein [Nocardioides sp. CER19]